MDSFGVVGGWPVDAAAVGAVSFGPPPPPGVPGDAGDAGSRVRLRWSGTAGLAARPFAWASVTKPVTALAVLVAVEEGTLHLEDAAGPPGATVAHLLAHASGLGPEGGAPLAPPGTRRIYSNAGFDLLGRQLAAGSGMPFGRYVAEAVLEPLAMSGTSFAPGPGTGAAAGLQGPLVDLLALAGEWAVPTLVSAETHARAIAVAYPGLAGVLPGLGRYDPCDWGLGVEVKGTKQPHWSGTTTSPSTFGHFGRSGSFVWVDPVAGVACAGLTDRPFGPWALTAWPALADAVLRECGDRDQV